MTSEAYENFRTQGYALAGGLGDLQQRAGVYHGMYEDSGKRNVFPLIAAHGALWASGYFRKGMLGGWLLSLPWLLAPSVRRAKLRSVAVFADQLRDINRRVCAESYAIYHYTRRFGATTFIKDLIGREFAEILCECHLARQFDVHFPRAQREKLFTAFFQWEQEHIVAPCVTEAFAQFDWPAIKFFALRPRIDFAYFGKSFIQFANFSSVDERIRHGLQAYRRAEEVGLEHVETSVGNYKVMRSKLQGLPWILLQFRM
jgi:hypothetical protein